MSNGIVPSPPQSPVQLPSPAFSPLPPPLPSDRHVRRGQEEYAIALSALLPQGIAWPRWPDSTLMKVVYGLSGIMGWADGRAADLLEIESDPRTTTEMLDSWERAWGLPDPCWPGPTSVSERRKILVMKMTLLGAQSAEFFTSVANYLGYSISITEYRPFMAGVDACGDNRTVQADGSLSDYPCQLGNATMRFAWTVHLQSSRLEWFRAGSGQCGIDPLLRIARAQDLECLFDRWGPAHAQVLFDYSGIGDPYAGTDQFYVMQRDGSEVVQRNATNVIDTRPITVVWPQAPTSFYVGSPTFDTPTMLVALAPPDPATTTWVSAVVLKGGTVSAARQQQIDLLIKRLKADGVWPALDRLWIFAAENDASALVDLVAAASATKSNPNVIVNVNSGYSGAGGFYINSNFNPVTAPQPKHYTRNGASIGVWTQGGGFGFAVADTSAYTYVDIWDGANVNYFAINTTQNSFGFGASTTYSFGMFVGNRSGATNCQSYYNGLEFQFSSDASGPLQSSPFYFCGNGSYAYSGIVSLGFIGGNMTPAQHKAFYNDLRNYFIGVNIPMGTPPAP
jgi:uncharacterized protein YmfQ (DUF2313 family)